MKKVFAFLLAAALLCSLCACGTKPAAQEDTRSAADIWQAMQAGIDPDDLPYLEEVDAQVLENFYGLTEAQAASFLCLFPQMNVIATEILIVKCVSGQEQAVLSAAEKRKSDLIETWQNYLPEQLALVEDARIVQSGQWLLFAVAGQADAIEAAFTQAVG